MEKEKQNIKAILDKVPNGDIINLLNERLKKGMEKYGHGLVIEEDTRKYGTKKNSFIEMALEELLDCLVYSAADSLRKNNKTNDSENKVLSEQLIKIVLYSPNDTLLGLIKLTYIMLLNEK